MAPKNWELVLKLQNTAVQESPRKEIFLRDCQAKSLALHKCDKTIDVHMFWFPLFVLGLVNELKLFTLW